MGGGRSYSWAGKRVRDDPEEASDIRVSRYFAVRPLQAEYFMTKFPDGANNRQNNFRFGAGIILRLGKK